MRPGPRLIAGASPKRRLALVFALAITVAVCQAPFVKAQDAGATQPAEHQPASEPGWLGAELNDLDPNSIKALGLDQAHALLVILPVRDGPAQKAGVKTGDVIVTLNAKPVPSLGEFIQQIRQAGKAAEVQLRIRRRDDSITLQIGLGGAKDARASEGVEEHIAAYDAIITAFPKKDFAALWAMNQNNLGLAYWKRIQGGRADNIEAAIKAFEAALTVYTREALPQAWAMAKNNLGIAYWNRIHGGRADNLEAAIEAFEAALTVLTREAFPESWATTQNNLGVAYGERIQGSSAGNLEAAIKAFEAALAVRTREALPQEWAMTQNNLGNAYGRRIEGSRANNLEAAIKAFAAALTIRTREAVPQDWALTQNNLGLAYKNRIQGSRAENLEAAIKAFEAALTVLTREAFPQDWAQTQNNLGLAYSDRIHGSRTENLEAAIKAYEAALTVRTRESFPQDWAQTQNNLGIAYWDRIQGSRAENLEAAIKADEAALTVRTREAFPQDWAQTQNNLGLAYWDRILGSRADNLEAAIKAFEAALTVLTREAFPQDWALTQINFGNAYQNRVHGSRAENLEAATKAFEAALTVYTREAFPETWATIQNNLGNAYQRRIRGSRADNLEAAVEAYEAALTVYTRETFPKDWAMTQNNLGNAYLTRIQGSRADNLEAAIKAFEAALTIRTREAYPRDNLQTSRLLARLFMQQRNWHEVELTLAKAREAFFVLFGEGIDETEARDVISLAGSLFADLAFAEAANGNAKAALTTLNEGRAHLLAAALRQQAAALTPAEEVALRSLQVEIREWSKLTEAKGVEGAEALRRRGEARNKLAALLAEVSRRMTAETGIVAIVRHGLLKDSALVAPIVTEQGGKFLVVTEADGAASIRAVELSGLTPDALKALLRETDKDGRSTGWLAAYEHQDGEPDVWQKTIAEIGPKLWSLFAGALDAELKAAGVKDGARLIVLPQGALGLLPLDLAHDPASGRSLAEAYEMTNIPSLEAYLAATRAAAMASTPSLAEAVNPTGDLPSAEVEGAIVASHFKDRPLIKLDHASAAPDVVLAGLKGKTYWHFASHGQFDWNDARKTGLVMKDGEVLTVGALLDARGSVGAPRLAVLSACETGLYDAARNPDEFVGLPAAFLELGAAGVIGSLWQVDDRATALLMARFYELHIDEGLSPPAALKQAKAWLRDATNRELTAYAQAAMKKTRAQEAQIPDLAASLRTRRRGAGAANGEAPEAPEVDPDEKQFAHPYFWSGFVYTGG